MSRAPFSPPLTPEAEDARELILKELGDPVYAEAQPSLVDRIWNWIVSWIPSIDAAGGAGAWSVVSLVLILLLLVGSAGLIWWLVGPVRRSKQIQKLADLDSDASVPAGTLRKQAEAAAGSRQWRQAVLLRFRAMTRELTERTVLVDEVGRTAEEVCHQASAAFPEHAAALHEGGEIFNEAAYSQRPIAESHSAAMAALDREIAKARPRHLRHGQGHSDEAGLPSLTGTGGESA